MFRLRVAGDVVAIMVFHVDDLKIAATEENTKVSCSQYPQPEISHQPSWGGRVVQGPCVQKRTLNISQTQLMRSVLNRFGVSKSSLIPATPSIYLRREIEEETVVDVPFREILGSLM